MKWFPRKVLLSGMITLMVMLDILFGASFVVVSRALAARLVQEICSHHVCRRTWAVEPSTLCLWALWVSQPLPPDSPSRKSRFLDVQQVDEPISDAEISVAGATPLAERNPEEAKWPSLIKFGHLVGLRSKSLTYWQERNNNLHAGLAGWMASWLWSRTSIWCQQRSRGSCRFYWNQPRRG